MYSPAVAGAFPIITKQSISNYVLSRLYSIKYHLSSSYSAAHTRTDSTFRYTVLSRTCSQQTFVHTFDTSTGFKNESSRPDLHLSFRRKDKKMERGHTTRVPSPPYPLQRIFKYGKCSLAPLCAIFTLVVDDHTGGFKEGVRNKGGDALNVNMSGIGEIRDGG